MRAVTFLFGVLAGCNGSSSPTAPSKGSAAAADPWNTTPVHRDDDPPTLTERHAIATRECPSVTRPYFYEIAKDDKVSHILGTRHIGVGLAKFPDNVRTYLHAAKRAIFEVAPDDHASSTAPKLELRRELGPDDWQRFEKLVGATTAQGLEHARPSSAILSMMVMYEDLGDMLDSEIESEVVTAKIPAGGLETAAFQDGVLDQLLDLRMFRTTVEQTGDRHEIEHDSTQDLHDYCTGADHAPGMDAETRAKMIKGGYKPEELDAMDEVLVYSRNRDWIPKLEPILAEGDVFIAVGADHLLGKRGVVSLLQARGFKVTRVVP